MRHILRSPIKDHLVSAVLNEIQYEREGYMINRSTVKGCVDVFLGLIADADTQETVYKRDLEPPFLKESEAFYRAEGERLAETCDSPEYLRRVRQPPYHVCLAFNSTASRRKPTFWQKRTEYTITYTIRLSPRYEASSKTTSSPAT